MKRARKYLLTLLMLIVAGGCIAAAGAWWGWREYTLPGPLRESKTVLFRRGTGVEAMAEALAREGVVRHAFMFKAASALSSKAGRFKAGEYAFPAGIPVKDVIAMLAEGRVVIHKITVPEGVTAREVVEILKKQEMLEGELDPAGIPEGSLLPETYHYVYGDQRLDLVTRMQHGMRTVMEELWPKRRRDIPIETQHDALTLASIVEKETGVDHERGRVAAVYINRLRSGMKLQADPTVRYGIILQEGGMNRPLTLTDLQTANPYNTYTNTGLPPGPIANPGRASIAAVLNPPDTNELFFVATGNGGHRFAATLDEHNRNVRDYRAVMRGKAE